MSSRGKMRRHVAVVIGSAELASAIARALHRNGFAAVMCDNVDPGCMRRGMAYADAWYVGDAQLDETSALYCNSARSVATVLAPGDVVVATAWSWCGIAQLLPTALVVDARNMREDALPRLMDRVGEGVLTIGASPWYSAGRNAHLTVLPQECREGAFAKSPGAPTTWDPMRQESHRRIVAAPAAGRFTTERHVGDYVLAGEGVGAIGRLMMYAPATGVLSGLVARGGRTFPGMPVVEVDIRGQPAHCFTVPDWCAEVATNVVQRALEHREPQAA